MPFLSQVNMKSLWRLFYSSMSGVIGEQQNDCICLGHESESGCFCVSVRLRRRGDEPPNLFNKWAKQHAKKPPPLGFPLGIYLLISREPVHRPCTYAYLAVRNF